MFIALAGLAGLAVSLVGGWMLRTRRSVKGGALAATFGVLLVLQAAIGLLSMWLSRAGFGG